MTSDGARAGPLAGLRVVDLTDDSGRFATKLLAECGAAVVRVGRGSPGPAMTDPGAAAAGGLLDWWYDGRKVRVDAGPLDLDTDAGRTAYRRLAGAADLVVETEPPGRLATLGIDHPDLVPANPRLTQVSLTPFGRTGPWRDHVTSDLVSAALGGVLSLCGEPDQPVNPWGRQAFNVAGFVAAISGLAAVRAAGVTGVGQLVDVAVHEAVCTTVEQLFFQNWFDDLLPYPKVAPRQGSLHWIRAYQVVPAREGWVLITPTPNAAGAIGWMVEEGLPEVKELLDMGLEALAVRIDMIMAALAALARTKDAGTLFRDAQARHVAFAEVLNVGQVATNPQHEFRGFFRPVPGGPAGVALPGPVAHFHATPAPAPAPPGDVTSIEDLLSEWGRPAPAPAGDAAIGKPLEGLRVLDLSHVLAGPMSTRVLGDLGADVIKVQTAERATTVNAPDFPYFYVWNRSKRDVALNLKDPRAVDIVRQLVERSDVLIENFSAGVLDRLGLSYDQASRWNPGIVYVTMSGCGHEGPWSQLVTYAPTIHALCGLTYLSNPPGRGDVGPGFSLNDHAAGLSAAVAILSALFERESSGRGQHVDISQMETGGYLIGPALLDWFANGREAQPGGNRDPFGHLVPNECYPTADDGWLAVTCRDDEEWARLLEATGLAADPVLAVVDARRARADEVDALVAAWAAGVTAAAGQQVLQAAGIPAGRIQDSADLMVDPQLEARRLFSTFDHAVFGTRPRDRFPGRFSAMDLEPYLPAPAYVGEHNFEVYGELLGMDEVAIAEGLGDGLFS